MIEYTIIYAKDANGSAVATATVERTMNELAKDGFGYLDSVPWGILMARDTPEPAEYVPTDEERLSAIVARLIGDGGRLVADEGGFRLRVSTSESGETSVQMRTGTSIIAFAQSGDTTWVPLTQGTTLDDLPRLIDLFVRATWKTA